MYFPELSLTFLFLQVFQEEFGVIKSYNLKPNGDKIPVTNQNRKGISIRINNTHLADLNLSLFLLFVNLGFI